MKIQADLLVEDIGELVPLSRSLPAWRPPGEEPWPPRVRSAALACREGLVVWWGEESRAAEEVELLAEGRRVSAEGGLVTPGFVDSHTHLIFGGDRAEEFYRRLRGVSYAEIARQGGGIRRTVRETRAASAEELLLLAKSRAAACLEGGTTTAEIKSGYGLDLETELKILRVAREVGEQTPLEVVATFLGAHETPAGDAPDRYLQRVISEMLPEVARQGLASFCDVFCERNVFDVAQSRRVLEAGLRHGLRPKLHAEQLSRFGGSELAAELRAASADHLEHATESDLARLAEAGVVGGLLPGASLFLGKEHYAPMERIRPSGLEVALATDCNPGTCMTESMAQILFLAVVKLGMDPGEALRAACLGGARSLGLDGRLGTLERGMQADFVIFGVKDLERLIYHFGVNHVRKVIKRGHIVVEREAATAGLDRLAGGRPLLRLGA